MQTRTVTKSEKFEWFKPFSRVYFYALTPLLQSMPVTSALMEMFVWWEAPIAMRVEWRCASMTSGEQCVMTPGTALMLLWSASSWDMLTLEVSVMYTASVS